MLAPAVIGPATNLRLTRDCVLLPARADAPLRSHMRANAQAHNLLDAAKLLTPGRAGAVIGLRSLTGT